MQWKIIKLNKKKILLILINITRLQHQITTKKYIFGGTTLMVVFELTRLHFAALIKGQINVLFCKRFSEQGRRW